MEKLTCDCEVIHEDAVREAKQTMASKEEYLQLASLMKMFGDGTRVQILHVLAQQEMCVCDLAVLMDMTKSATSHQLRILRENNLVKFEKVGKHSYYSLADDHVKDILDIALDHVNE